VTVRTTITNRGTLDLAAGTLRIENTFATDFTNAFEGVVSGVGTLDVSTLPTDRVANTGRTAPGPGPGGAGVGTLTWVGPYTPGPQAFLVAEVGPGAVGDRLAVNGVAALGTLQVLVRPTGGYAPAVGDAFGAITATGGVTPVDTVQTVNPTGDVVFEPDYSAPNVVTLRAVAGQPAPPFAVLPSPLVSGGERTVSLIGDGLSAAGPVALVCVDCGHPERFGRIPGEVLSAGPGLMSVRFDVVSALVYGTYEVEVGTGATAARSRVEVVPYISLPLVLQSGGPGVIIRPFPAAGTTEFSVYNLSNSAEPSVSLLRVEPPSPAVRFEPFAVRTVPGDPTPPMHLFVPARPIPSAPTRLSVLAAIAPEDVLFPGQTPGDGANVPFGSPQPVAMAAYGFLSPAQLSRSFADLALSAASDLGLPLDTASARAAADAAVDVLLGEAPYEPDRHGRRSLFGDIASELGVVPVVMGPLLPGGVGEAIAPRLNEAMRNLGAGAFTGRQEFCVLQSEEPELIRHEVTHVLQQQAGQLPGPLVDQAQQANGGPTNPFAAVCPDAPDNRPVFPQPVRGPFDPNDKAPGVVIGCELVGTGADAHCGRYLIPLASQTEPLSYTVQFENVPEATGSAETVTITDVLDDDLDPATFEVLASTADSLLTTTVSGQTVTFTFAGIDLPPNQTAPEGQGAVTYRVSPRPGLVDGTEIHNTASIVFDFNPAIVTPTVVHVVRATADLAVSIQAPDYGPFQSPLVYTVSAANPAGADAAEAAVLTVPVPMGATLLSAETTVGTCSGTTTVSCALGALAGGAEALVSLTVQLPPMAGQAVLTASGSSSTFDGAWYNDAASRTFTVTNGTAGEDGPGAPTEVFLDGNRPNPFTARTTFRLGLPAAAPVSVTLVDLLGRVVLRAVDGPMEAGWHDVTVEGGGLASGVYVAVLKAGDVVRTRRVLVVR
ncbi:MAG TPA: T9SS type A sorting domain-containing protein, partial [Rubricoccaceae bacterium]|jgi:hypothetical protein